MHKLHIENVSKFFGHPHERALAMLKDGASKDAIFQKTKCSVGVRHASFHVDAGEIVVVMGLSGSGKSTLLRCLNRLIEPTAGKIRIDDVDITALDGEGLRQLRLTKLGMVFQHFALFPHRTVLQNAEYGLGIQGVGLARALALNPDILLMDEAFSALDPLIRRDMQDERITLQKSLQKRSPQYPGHGTDQNHL